jgi:hypothetical protein
VCRAPLFCTGQARWQCRLSCTAPRVTNREFLWESFCCNHAFGCIRTCTSRVHGNTAPRTGVVHLGPEFFPYGCCSCLPCCCKLQVATPGQAFVPALQQGEQQGKAVVMASLLQHTAIQAPLAARRAIPRGQETVSQPTIPPQTSPSKITVVRNQYQQL